MYRIWTKMYVGGVYAGSSVSAKEYVRIGNAVRVAREKYSEPKNGISWEWVVASKNPWWYMEEI